MPWRVLFLCLALIAAAPGAERPARDPAALAALAARLAPLHARKTAAEPGEWLAEHREPGQSFAQYRASDPNRPTAVRTTLHVVPLGAFSPPHERLLAETGDFLGRFYGLPVRTAARAELDGLPAEARRIHPLGGEQVLSGAILDLLRARRPADAVAVLGLTASDLWPGMGWNFVFGEASLRDRVGVWSVHRFGDPVVDGERCRRRTLKTAVHETGHMLGIQHCTAYECLMNGSNHLRETDSRPLAFCPECVAKVWWACGVDPLARARDLQAFCMRHALTAEAAGWERAAALLAP